MSPINNVLLCCSRASFSVSSRNHETVQIFYRICSAKLSFKSFTIVLMEVSYRHSAALVFACFLYRSSLNTETLREFRMTTLANVMLNFFSVVLNDVSYKQCAALLCSCFLFCSSLSVENVQIFCRICSAKLIFNFHSLLFRWQSPISAALLWFSLASYIVQVSILKVFESFGRLHLQIWCWNFLCGSHWCLLSTMCCFAVLVLPFLFQVAIMKLFKSSIEYALQNSVSNHSRLFWWKSLIGVALLWFSLASFNVQVSILKLFESFGWLHLQMWCWIFLCGSYWCFL